MAQTSVAITIDTEKDLHTGTSFGITEGLPLFLEKARKYNIKLTFFVTAEILEEFPEYFRALDYEGHEIALHGLEHERFDILSYFEKEKRIKKAVEIYEKVLFKKPKGFRAPQHSADKELITILSKYKLAYDSSYTPFNVIQLLFFPKRFKLWTEHFFSSRKKYKITKSLYEIPTSSFLMPFVSLAFRVFPKPLIPVYFKVIRAFNREIIFYAHSWDFIKLGNSRIDKIFPHYLFIEKIIYLIEKLSKRQKFKFVRVEDLI